MTYVVGYLFDSKANDFDDASGLFDDASQITDNLIVSLSDAPVLTALLVRADSLGLLLAEDSEIAVVLLVKNGTDTLSLSLSSAILIYKDVAFAISTTYTNEAPVVSTSYENISGYR